MTTILTTCKGRLSSLRASLPTWLKHTRFDVLVVDYSCPEGAADWAEELAEPRVRALRVKERREGLFNKPHALNVGLAELHSRNERRALLLDADTALLKPIGWFVNADNQHDNQTVMRISAGEPDLTGAIDCNVRDAIGIGGFDENFVGYGAEDLDFRVRLYAHTGASVRLFPRDFLAAEPHGDDLRVRYHDQKDKQVSGAANLELLRQKFLSPPYCSYAEDPVIRALLGERP